MADLRMEDVLAHLLKASGGDGEGDGMRRAVGPPASQEQLAALEQHWGRGLPPSYRRVLGIYNGMERLWFDVRLLSIEDIIDGAREIPAIDGSPSERRTWIFAHGTESADALAFDPSQIREDGEMAVVHVNESGEGQRWTSLAELLQELFRRLFFGFRGSGATTYYVWTNLWDVLPSDSGSHHSRTFSPGRGVKYAEPKELFTRVQEVNLHLLLSEAEQEKVDLHFEQAIKAIEIAERKLVIVLTDGPPFDAARFYYVYYEPCADLVIALSPFAPDPLDKERVVIYADSRFWDTWASESKRLLEQAEQLLGQARIADALLLSIDEACRWLAP